MNRERIEKYFILKLLNNLKITDELVPDVELEKNSSFQTYFSKFENSELVPLYHLLSLQDNNSFVFKPLALNIDIEIEDLFSEKNSIFSNHSEIDAVINFKKLYRNDLSYINLMTLCKYCFSYISLKKEGFKYASLYQILKINSVLCANKVLFNGDNQLACIDLSGIQSFIYNISGKKAASSLKGRSFYLQFLIDSAISLFIKEFNQTENCIVYASGGKAYLLVNKQDKNKIGQFRSKLNSTIFEKYNTQLYFCFDAVDFNEDKISETWRELSLAASTQKSKKHSSLLVNNYSSFFNPIPNKAILENHHVCSVSGEVEHVDNLENLGTKDEPLYVSKMVNEQIKLGIKLKEFNYQIKGIKNKGFKSPFEENETIDLFDNVAKINDKSIEITEINYFDEKTFNENPNYRFKFYGGNTGSYSFEDLINAENGNFNKLGVLRMDVDNLGQLFISGIPNQYRNPETYATLSFSLDYFFSGFTNHILNNNDFKNSVSIIYSGGDDVFAVGNWNKIISFSSAINQNFKKFTQNTKSASCGIAIVNEKFPIAKAADMAGEFEDKAKDFNNKSKNAICFFEEVMSWEEFKTVENYKKELLTHLSKQENELSRSFLHKLMQFKMIKDEGIKKIKSEKYKHYWLSAYYLKRFKDKVKDKDKELGNYIDNITKTILAPRQLDLIAIAARWVELELR